MRFWRNIRKRKPKLTGWYQCIVVYGVNKEGDSKAYVMDLYWYSHSGRFVDNRRQNVFMMYDVYSNGDPYHKNALTTDDLCDRTKDVIAWRPMPNPYQLKILRKLKRERRK